VAYSLLSKDLSIAHAIDDRLKPTLRTFLYDRKKEKLLGSDGMDRFAVVFGEQARLTVILYSPGWGETRWTAFEQSHIKERALNSRMTSFIVVRLDDEVEALPKWIPENHLCASVPSDGIDGVAAVIRARAREKGAILRKESAAEYALRQKEQREAAAERESIENSARGVEEATQEVATLFDEMRRILEEIKAADPKIDLTFGESKDEFGMSSRNGSMSAVWEVRQMNTLRDSYLRVNSWDGRIQTPSSTRRAAGSDWSGAIGYRPSLSETGTWVWRSDSGLDKHPPSDFITINGSKIGDPYLTTELADFLVHEQLKRLYETELRWTT
jgi:hypothetical protein